MSQLSGKFIINNTITLNKFNQGGATTGQIMTWTGATWAPTTPASPTIVETATSVASTATADTLVTGFTVTPIAGVYLVTISARIEMSSTNSTGTCRMFMGGSAQANTIRTIGVNGATSISQAIHIIKLVTLNGSQAVDLRWSHSNGGFNILDRSIVCQRIS